MIDSSSETDPDKTDPEETDPEETDPADPERLDPTEWLAHQFATRAQPVLDPSGSIAPAVPSPFVSRPELVSPSRGNGPARGSAVDPFPPALPEQLLSTDTYFANVGGQLPPVTAAIAVPPPATAVPPPVAAVQEPDASIPDPPGAEPVSEPDVPPPFQWDLIPGGRFDPGRDVCPADLSGVPLQDSDGGASPSVAREPERPSVVPSVPIPPAPPASVPSASTPGAPVPSADAPGAPAPGTPAPNKPIFSTSIEPAFRSPRRAGAFLSSGEAPPSGYPSSPPSGLDEPGHPAPPVPPDPGSPATSTLQPWGTPGSGFPSSPPTQDPRPPRAGSSAPDGSDAALPASRPAPPSQDVPPARPVPPQSLFTAPPLVPSRVDQSPLPPAAGLPAFASRDQVQVSDVPTQAYRFERNAPVDPVLPAPVSAAQSVGTPVDDVRALPAHDGEEVEAGEVRAAGRPARDRTEPSGLDALFGDALFGDTLSNGTPPPETGPPRGRRSARAEIAPEEREESARQESVWPGPPVTRPEMPAGTGAPISSAPDPGTPDASTSAESTPALSAPDLGAGPSSPDPNSPDLGAPTARTRRSAQPISTTPVSTAQKVLFGVCLGVVLVLAAIVLFLLVARPANASPGATPNSGAVAAVSALPASGKKPVADLLTI